MKACKEEQCNAGYSEIEKELHFWKCTVATTIEITTTIEIIISIVVENAFQT